MLVKSFLFSLVLLSSSVGSQAIAADKAMLDQGHQVYYNHCLHCHGENGKGDGHLVSILKVTPTDLTQIDQDVAKKVLGAVLGQHKSGYEESKMPLLKQALSLEEVYAVTEYIESF